MAGAEKRARHELLTLGITLWLITASTAPRAAQATLEPPSRGELPAAEQATVDLFEDVRPSLHVLRGAAAAEVVLHDQSNYRAELVGFSRGHDLAVLRIDAPSDVLRRIAIGRSDDLQVGQSIFAIGNPFGLSATLTTGIVSALGREIATVGGGAIENAVQTDAAINPGNSGGPLLDSARAADGRLILGDIIQAIDGDDLSGLAELQTVLDRYVAGDQVTVTTLRNGQSLDVRVRLF